MSNNEKILNNVIEVSNDDILPNRFQPRKHFDEENILELSESIKEHGMFQPIIVRKIGDKYEIIAGERRYKANILAGNDTVPIIVKNLDDKESSEVAVIENIQRQDLTPIEEAISYKRILDMGYITQEQLARKIGKSQSAIANKIRLLKLSDEVQEALMEKQISERHARSLLKLESLKDQNLMLDRIINERLTVRKTDEEIKNMNNNVLNNNENIVNPTINNSVESNVVTSPIMGTPINFDQNTQPIKEVSTNNIPNSTLNNSTMMDNSVSEPIMNQPINIDTVQKSIPEVPINTIPTDIPNNPTIMDNSVYMQNINSPINDFNNNSVPSFNNTIPDINSTAISNGINLNNNDSIVNDMNLGNASSLMDQPLQSNFKLNNSTMIDDIQNSFMSNSSITPEVTSQDTLINNIPSNDIGINGMFSAVEQPLETTFNTNPIQIENEQNSFVQNSMDVPLESTPISDLTQINPIENPTPFNEPQLNSVEEYTNSLNQLTSNRVSQPIVNQPIEDIPTFKKEQPIETNAGIATPIVDLNKQPQSEQQIVDVPLNNNIEEQQSFIQPETIIVPNDDQFDPVMPAKESTEPTIDFKTIINLIRQCSQIIEKCGYKIETEEYDLNGRYQVTFNIETE